MAYDRSERPERSDRPDRGEGRGDKKSFGGPRRKKTCPFSGDNAQTIDWKDTRLLGRFISERGKIMPGRITAVNTTKQRELAQAIKRARFMALLPYLRDETPTDRAPREYDRPRGDYDRPREGGYDRAPRTEKGE